MTQIDEARYGRACLFALNVCPFTLRHVIDDYYTKKGSPDMQDFLEKNKHDLYHIMTKKCCCRRIQSRVTPMYRSQWNLLYMRNRSPCRGTYSAGGDCPCKFDPIPGITSNVMDITLCSLVIKNICQGPGINMIHIDKIPNIRNKLIHASSATLDAPTYNGYWSDVKTAILDLANSVSPSVHKDTLKMIEDLEKRVMNKYELEEIRKVIVDQKKLEERVSDIEKDLEETNKSIMRVEGNVRQLEGNVNQRVTELEENVKQKELTKIGKTLYSRDGTEYSIQIDAHDTQLDEHSTQLATLDTEVDRHDTQLDELSTQLATLDKEVDRHDTQLDEHSTQLATLDKEVDRHDRAQLDRLDTGVQSHGTQLDEHERHLDSLDESCQNHETQIANIKEQLKSDQHNPGLETHFLGDDHTEILNLLKEAKKEYTGIQLSLYRDSKDNAVIIGYNTTMSRSKIEIPEKYNGRLRIQNPRNVSDEALMASQYALENRIKLDHQQQDMLQSCIARYSSQLWDNHSNLTMISGDCIKYIGGFPTERFCVVLYCLSKGFRPFKEDLFPTSLQEKGQDIPVDVREGYFLLGPIDLVGRVSEWNDPVCMGSSIGNKRDDKTGSVGLFVDLQNNLMGFITCCHVLFDCIRMVSFDKCYKEPVSKKEEDDAYFTVQPSLPSFCGVGKEERICGFVERAVFKPESVPVSVDAALVRITRRIPNTGHFTIRDNTQIKEAGYSPNFPPLYNGGKILCQIPSEEREKPLIKSGSTTGLTKGEFKMNGLEVSIPEDGSFLGDSAVYFPKRAMKGQYEIRSSMTFFDLGDSGSAVFLKNTDGSLKCVGIAIGRTSYYTTVVTPIGAILQALGLKENDVTDFGEPMNLD